jgi:hypothetical protein
MRLQAVQLFAIELPACSLLYGWIFSILSRHSEMFEQSIHRIRFIWLKFFFFVSAVD